MRTETLITDARIASMVPGKTPYGVIEDGAIAITGNRIASNTNQSIMCFMHIF